jgi:quercetin dioxygenase-like cupin family protein
MNDDLLPPRIRELPQMGNHIPAHFLSAPGCDVLFVPCPAGTELPPHSHDTDNLGVILSGEAIVTSGGETRPYGPGEWYATAAGEEHAVRFEVDTVQIELRFEPADGARAR